MGWALALARFPWTHAMSTADDKNQIALQYGEPVAATTLRKPVLHVAHRAGNKFSILRLTT
jgi:hypothetical protein